jgi:dephospho-CoA kinase
MVHKPVIGLIGGMGSGKSLVAEEFARHGGKVISGDQLGHEGLRQPAIRDRLVGRWGSDVLTEDGDIDRHKVAAIVFNDQAELQALQSAVYPWIERRFREEVAAAEQEPAVKFIVLDAAVMLEAGWNNVCNWLVYVHAPRHLRLRRLAEQRGWGAKEVEAREAAQWPLTEKVTRADFAVDNAGSRSETARQVESLLRRLGLLPAA